MPGRNRKIIELATGKISKQEKLNRAVQEEKIKLDRKALELGAPDWLNDMAKEEYNRVVTEAKKINLYDNLDLPILAIYADCYARYVETSQALQKFGSVQKVRNRTFTSPYIAIADKLATQILKCSTKLGLAVSDRLRLIVPTREEKSVNKFLKDLG